jgi:hypothetical protein
MREPERDTVMYLPIDFACWSPIRLRDPFPCRSTNDISFDLCKWRWDPSCLFTQLISRQSLELRCCQPSSQQAYTFR